MTRGGYRRPRRPIRALGQNRSPANGAVLHPFANEAAGHDSAPQVARNTRTQGAVGKMRAGAES